MSRQAGLSVKAISAVARNRENSDTDSTVSTPVPHSERPPMGGASVEDLCESVVRRLPERHPLRLCIRARPTSGAEVMMPIFAAHAPF